MTRKIIVHGTRQYDEPVTYAYAKRMAAHFGASYRATFGVFYDGTYGFAPQLKRIK